MRLHALRPLGGRPPPATLWTILAAAGALVAWAFADGPHWVAERVALGGEALRAGAVWTLVTSLAVHLDARELLANVVGLWIFGSPLERAWGSRSFARFVLVAGVLANLPTGGLAALGMPGIVSGLGASTAALLVAWSRLYGHLRLGFLANVIVARHLAYAVLGVTMLGNMIAGDALRVVHLAAGAAAGWYVVEGPPPSVLLGRFLRWRRRRRVRVVRGGRGDDRFRWN